MDITSLVKLSKETTNPARAKDALEMTEHIKLLAKYMAVDGVQYVYSREKSYDTSARIKAQLAMITTICQRLLPETYKPVIEHGFNDTLAGKHAPSETQVNQFIEHMMDLIHVCSAGDEAIAQGNVFLGIEEKIDRANKSMREGNKEGLFSNLHTIFEILLKDKLGIALDIDGAKLGKVLRICIRNEIFKDKTSILKQLNDNVAEIDNKMKHSGYDPTIKEMNDALLISTQAIRILKGETPNITDSVKEEILNILVKHN